MLEGLLGKHWSEEQQLYRTENNLATSGRKWAQLIIRRLWKIAWDLWSHRNMEAHKNDSQIQRDQLIVQVHHEFDIGHQGYQDLKKVFTSEEQGKVISGNIQYLQCWLRMVQARRQRILRKQEESTDIQQMRTTMRQFLL